MRYVACRITGVSPHVLGIESSLRLVVDKKASVARYGDGELDIILGKSIPFQKYNGNLADRLQKILHVRYEDFFVGLPDIFQGLSIYNQRATHYYHNHLRAHLPDWQRLADTSIEYICTGITRPYIDLKDKTACSLYFDLMKNVWCKQDVLIVEGCKSRLGVGNDLFNGCSSIERILCPAVDAFAHYDEILSKVLETNRSKMVLLALGPTATVLAYDLYRCGYRALDIGHVDIEYEWFRMGAEEKVAVKNKYTNEAETRGGLDVGECLDKAYWNQVIGTVGC